MSFRCAPRCERGFSILELLTVLSVMGVLSGIAAFGFRELERPANNAATLLASTFKQARARALSSTTPFTVTASSSTHVIVTYGTSCSAGQTTDTTLDLELPRGAYMNDTAWSVCFNTRGLADTSLSIGVSDGGESKQVEVVLGGATRVL